MENSAGIFLLGLRLVLILLLYGFLFWAIRIIWKDFNSTITKESHTEIPPILLTVPSENQLTQTFTTEEIIIGRSPICDFQISDHTVSSKHARIYFSHNQWWVEDYGSSNGSYLNEILVKTPAVLTFGDQLRLGKIEINIDFSQ